MTQSFLFRAYLKLANIYRRLRSLPLAFFHRTRTILRRLWVITNPLRAIIAYPFTWKRLGKHIQQVWPGDNPCADSRRAAIFAHYDPHGQIADYVAHYVKALAEAGLGIYFVSNCRMGKSGVFESEIAKVKPWTREIIRRRNVGYDIGAYKDGVARIGNAEDLESLLFVNDSVYGPFFPLRDVIEKGRALSADFWGLTESAVGKYHVMSYFICFNQSILASRRFVKFWKRQLYPLLKSEAIICGETALTRFMHKSGFRSRVVFRYKDFIESYIEGHGQKHLGAAVRKNRPVDQYKRYIYESVRINRKPLHITQSFWRELILSGYPFIKRDLLSTNHIQVGNLASWISVIRNYSSYDADLILNHMRGLEKPSLRDITADLRYGRSRLPWPNPIKMVWSGDDPCANSKRAAVFFHYDKSGIIDEYVVHHVKELAKAGLRIYFVSSAKKRNMLKRQIEKIRPWTCEIIHRRNTGLDIGGYKDGIAHIGNLETLDGLLLVNDTIYGPFSPLSDLIERGEALPADFWGIIDSPKNLPKERDYFIQSHFIYFHSSVLRSPVFRKFWRTLPYFKSRRNAVRYGEIRLSRLLIAAGFRPRALFEYHEIAEDFVSSLNIKKVGSSKSSNAPLKSSNAFDALRFYTICYKLVISPTEWFWDHLITSGFPYLKSRVLRNAAIKMLPSEGLNYHFHRIGEDHETIAEWMQAHISIWEQIIRRHSDYDTNMIHDHLNRFRTPKSLDV
ncbi:MAG: hypothetical protein OXU78_01270 [Deltaproteobacteria bacterium]|nr:hypothetical protein [Deltaproteobacteria bacterium]